MRGIIKTIFLTAGLLAMACVAAEESERGFYGGIAIGADDFGWDGSSVGGGFSSLSESRWPSASDQPQLSDRTWKLFSGYHFNRYLAIEAAWTDPDETSESQPGAQRFLSTNPRPNTEGLSFGAVGTVPVAASVDLFAKASVSGWGLAGLSTLAQSAQLADDDEESGSTMLGLGAEYGLSERLSIRTEWQRFNDDGFESGRDFLSIGISSRF